MWGAGAPCSILGQSSCSQIIGWNGNILFHDLYVPKVACIIKNPHQLLCFQGFLPLLYALLPVFQHKKRSYDDAFTSGHNFFFSINSWNVRGKNRESCLPLYNVAYSNSIAGGVNHLYFIVILSLNSQISLDMLVFIFNFGMK